MQLAQARVPCDKKSMESPLEAGKFYIVSAPAACTVSQTSSKGDEVIVAQIPETGGQRRFLSIATLAVLDNDDAVVSGPFSNAPDLGAQAGGYIESNLNVGHGASAAVAAVCTLTLGDPTAEGDLTDNAEHALHLDAQPALQSHGVLTVADATESGTLSIGGEVVENFTEKKETPASISLALLVDVSELHGEYGFGLQYNGELWCTFATYITDTTGEAFAEELGNAERWKLPDGTALGFAPVEATWDSTTEKITMVSTAKQGVDGDNVAVEDGPMCPFFVPQVESNFSGGQDARTMEEALAYVEGVVNNYDGLEAEVDAENNAVLVTASEPGAAGDLLTLGFEGDLLEVTEQMDGGQDARTYAEVIAAINGDDGAGEPTYPMGVKAEATLVEVGQITLTSRSPGAAANAITYTATGCFGSGTVKQGSTTRGKNAVTQTAFKIYLNGEEFTGGSVTIDPAPTQGSTNAVSSGGVFVHTNDRARHVNAADKTGWNAAILCHEYLNTLPVGNSNFYAHYIILNEKQVPRGFLKGVSLHCRNAGTAQPSPFYLGVFEQQEGGSSDPATWSFLGVSTAAVQEVIGETREWSFDGIELAGGRTVALCSMLTPDEGWNTGAQFGLRVSERPEDDTISRVDNGAFIPQMTLSVMVMSGELVVALKKSLNELTERVSALEETAN